MRADTRRDRRCGLVAGGGVSAEGLAPPAPDRPGPVSTPSSTRCGSTPTGTTAARRPRACSPRHPRVHGRRLRDVPSRARLPRTQRGDRLAREHGAGRHRRGRGHRDDAVDPAVRRPSPAELDGAVRAPAHARIRDHASADRPDQPERAAQRSPQSQGGADRRTDHGGLPLVADDQRSPVSVRLRHRHRRCNRDRDLECVPRVRHAESDRSTSRRSAALSMAAPPGISGRT